MRGIVLGSWIVLSLTGCRAPAAQHSLRPAGTPRIEIVPRPAPVSPTSSERSSEAAVTELWTQRPVPSLARSSDSHPAEAGRNPPATWTGVPFEADASGTRLAVDFGVGEHRYDDGLRSLEPLPPATAGFSDSVLQMGIRRRLAPGAFWTGGFAAIRHQDEPILSDLEETEVGWVTVGVQLQF